MYLRCFMVLFYGGWNFHSCHLDLWWYLFGRCWCWVCLRWLRYSFMWFDIFNIIFVVLGRTSVWLFIFFVTVRCWKFDSMYFWPWGWLANFRLCFNTYWGLFQHWSFSLNLPFCPAWLICTPSFDLHCCFDGWRN